MTEAGEQLVEALSDEAKGKILTVLIREGSQLNPTRICDRAGIDLETFYDHIDDLEAADLVLYTLIVGNGPVYEVNLDTFAEALEDVNEERIKLT